MEPFKNLLGVKAAQKIAVALKRAHPSFRDKDFLEGMKAGLEPLELKNRMIFIKSRMEQTLPTDPAQSFPILVLALKQNEKDEVGLESFLVWPLTQFIADHGGQHFKLSMDSLHSMTQVFTAEFAIRKFLIAEEKRTLEVLHKWTRDPSEHVRRLASEGSRPLLPWGERLVSFVESPEKTWSVLEALKSDPAFYVRKSVANHINDHSKNHGDWVISRLKKWVSGASTAPELNWIVRHGTRTLIKQGHVGALALQGVGGNSIRLKSARVLTTRVRVGGKLRVEVTIKNESRKKALALVDHELNLRGARSGQSRSKIFKGKKLELEASQSTSLVFEIPIRVVTVRKYYSGTQYWTPIVNGKKAKPKVFTLNAPASS